MKELELVKRINGQAGRCVAADFTLDGIARFGHLAFVLYGLWLWFGGRKEDRTARRTAAVTALLGVAACSLLSWGHREIVAAAPPLCAGRPHLEFHRPQGERRFSEQSHHEQRGHCGGDAPASYARREMARCRLGPAGIFPNLCGYPLPV